MRKAKMELIQFIKPAIKLDDEDYAKIKEVIDSGWVSIGKYMLEFENEFKKRYNVKYAIACSNCTQGLIISLKAAGWRNKRIAVPAFTWPSTIYAIESNIGNIPVFCDIDPKTWTINLDFLDYNSYDVILAVDTFGNQIKHKTDKPIIYDAAHGFDLKDLGHRGLAEVVSFSFTKVVTSAEGGMILTNDDSFAETAFELRRLSARMTEINAIIGLKSIKNYKHNFQKKLSIIKKYKDSFKFDYDVQYIPECTNHSVFSIVLKNTQTRNAIAGSFKRNNIETKIYYEPLVEGLPVTDWLYSHIISLLIYPDIEEKLDYICNLINESVAKSSHLEDSFVPSSIPVPGKKYLKESGYLKHYIEREA